MKKSTRICGVTLVAATSLSLIVAPLPARAQYTNTYTGRTWNNPLSSYLDLRLQQSMESRRLRERFLEGQRTEERGRSSRPISASDFRATGTRLLPDTMAEMTPDATAEQKSQLRALYLEMLKAFEQQARKNNVAYALAFAIGASAQAVNGRELSESDAEALALELNDVLASSPTFQRSSPRQKQSLYEAAIITGGLIGVMYQMGADQEDAELKRQAEEMGQVVITQLLGAQPQ